MSSAGGAAAAAAAAARRRRLRKEEEQMTNYSTDDMQGWEFKIVRSATEMFRNPETLRRVCEEEARNGWELLEKFDNSRVRFKRSVERRSSDAHAAIDPYRTHVGLTEGHIALLIIVPLIVFGAAALFLFAR